MIISNIEYFVNIKLSNFEYFHFMEVYMSETIGSRIKNRRKELGLTQVQVRQLTGISNGNLSGIENGNILPSSNALISLSEILKVSADWILTGKYSILDIQEQNQEPKMNTQEESFLNCFRQLDPEDQDEILEMMNMKIRRKNRRAKSSRSQGDSDIVSA